MLCLQGQGENKVVLAPFLRPGYPQGVAVLDFQEGGLD